MILLALYGKQTTNAWIKFIQYTLGYLYCEYLVNFLRRLKFTGQINLKITKLPHSRSYPNLPYDCSNVIRRLYIISVYICTSSYHHCALIVEAVFANYIIA